jgi:hypothetical protein
MHTSDARLWTAVASLFAGILIVIVLLNFNRIVRWMGDLIGGISRIGENVMNGFTPILHFLAGVLIIVVVVAIVLGVLWWVWKQLRDREQRALSSSPFGGRLDRYGQRNNQESPDSDQSSRRSGLLDRLAKTQSKQEKRT